MAWFVLIFCLQKIMYLQLALIFLFLILVFLYLRNRRSRIVKGPTFLLFIDAPDPDNPAAALALLKHQLSDPHSCLHVILTGRPVDFNTEKYHTSSYERRSSESYVLEHSERLLEDSAARISIYLEKCTVRNQVKIYNGGIAPTAPLSDSVHDWDFLFDRKDLLTHNDSDVGEVLSPAEYQKLVNKYNAMTKGRRAKEFLSILRHFDLIPLETLKNEISGKHCERIDLYIGGPVTAVPHLFDCKALRMKVNSLYGMFGALEPGKGTLLKNQFNVACDIDSACQVFMEDMFPKSEKFLVTTETCKQKPLVISSSDLQQYGAFPHITKLQLLWESTHSYKEQPLFDVLPVMASLEECKGNFKWLRRRAVLRDGKFYLINSYSGNLYVSQVFTGNREHYVKFLVKMWC